MLNDFNYSCPVYLACGYTDLRYGIDGLARLVQQKFKLIETAKETGLNPYRYLLYVLRTAPKLCLKNPDWARQLMPANAPADCRTPASK